MFPKHLRYDLAVVYVYIKAVILISVNVHLQTVWHFCLYNRCSREAFVLGGLQTSPGLQCGFKWCPTQSHLVLFRETRPSVRPRCFWGECVFGGFTVLCAQSWSILVFYFMSNCCYKAFSHQSLNSHKAVCRFSLCIWCMFVFMCLQLRPESLCLCLFNALAVHDPITENVTDASST